MLAKYLLVYYTIEKEKYYTDWEKFLAASLKRSEYS